MSEGPSLLLGQPRFGGILVVSDHASNRVPDDIDLGIEPGLLEEHIAVDRGTAGVAAALAERSGVAAYVGNVSRLVCDYNRDVDAAGVFPEASDGHVIPGNALSIEERKARLDRFYHPYHEGLSALLDSCPPSLILSVHSFTPQLETKPEEKRPWQVGVLYNEDDRAARLAIPLLKAEGLCVGDQQPYSGRLLNETMNRHAEADGRPYLGVEIRQDEIATPEAQKVWAERLHRICNEIALSLT